MPWWTVSAALLVCGVACAQEQARIGIVRGAFVAWQSETVSSGVLLFTDSAKLTWRCGFDRKTYVERDHQISAVSALDVGDPLEIVADHKPGLTACYARMIHVIESSPPKSRSRLKPQAGPVRAIADIFGPRGDLTYHGVVLRTSAASLVIRVSGNDERTFVLRADTLFAGEGLPAEASSLAPNTIVFVRAGRNLDNQIEAYQVIWGSIVQVH